GGSDGAGQGRAASFLQAKAGGRGSSVRRGSLVASEIWHRGAGTPVPGGRNRRRIQPANLNEIQAKIFRLSEFFDGTIAVYRRLRSWHKRWGPIVRGDPRRFNSPHGWNVCSLMPGGFGRRRGGYLHLRYCGRSTSPATTSLPHPSQPDRQARPDTGFGDIHASAR